MPHIRLALVSLAFVIPSAVPAGSVADLSWLSGDWETGAGDTRIEEHWTRPDGGTLLGMGRTVRGGKTAFFEYLRIETRDDGIYYVAHPKARPGTDFKATQVGPDEVVFENPEHDFPKRIVYRKEADGSVTARVEGDGTEPEKAQEFRFRRTAPPTAR